MPKLFKFVAILVLAATGQTSYAAVTFNLDVVVNGPAPSGSTPFMSATFADGAANHVTLTLNNDLGAGQFISDVVFNSLVDPTKLTFNRVGGAPPTINNLFQHAVQDMDGSASIKAGLFNIDIDFAPPPGGPTNVFNSTNSPVVYDISGPDLMADSFKLHSLPGGPGYLDNSYLMAAKVQGIGNRGLSGSIGFDPVSAPVPEPEIYAMMGIGLALMGFVVERRKRGRQKNAAA